MRLAPLHCRQWSRHRRWLRPIHRPSRPEPPPPAGPSAAAKPKPVAPWKSVPQQPVAVADRVLPSWLGPQETGSSNVDPQEMFDILTNVVGNKFTNTTVWPAITLGPPQWMDNGVARCCEAEYTRPKERFTQRDAQCWWRPLHRGRETHPPEVGWSWSGAKARHTPLDCQGTPSIRPQ